MTVLLRTVELEAWAVVGSWILFWLAMFLAFAAGSLAVKVTKQHVPSERDRALRTNWTAA